MEKDKMLTPRDIVRIREPVREEDRSQIRNTIHVWTTFAGRLDEVIGGEDRSFDRLSDSYGNAFHDFSDWPSDEPLSEQLQAEYFLMMCFKDTVIRMMESRKLTPEQAEFIIWFGISGRLTSAACMVQHILRERKKEEEAHAEDGT